VLPYHPLPIMELLGTSIQSCLKWLQRQNECWIQDRTAACLPRGGADFHLLLDQNINRMLDSEQALSSSTGIQLLFHFQLQSPSTQMYMDHNQSQYSDCSLLHPSRLEYSSLHHRRPIFDPSHSEVESLTTTFLPCNNRNSVLQDNPSSLQKCIRSA
jgi:hypothetical protein